MLGRTEGSETSPPGTKEAASRGPRHLHAVDDLPSLTAKLIDLEDQLEDVATSDYSELSTRDLESAAYRLECLASVLDAARATATAALDESYATIDHRGLTTGDWLAFAAHTPPAAATRRARVARRVVDEFPALLEALVAQNIRWAHIELWCKAVTKRVAEPMRALLPELISLAGELTYLGWAREVYRVARHFDEDGAFNPEREAGRNRLYVSQSFDGTYEIQGRLVGALGASFAEMLERATDALWLEYRNAQDQAGSRDGENALEIPDRSTLRALALVDLMRHGVADGNGENSRAPIVELTLVHQPQSGTDHDEFVTATGHLLSETELGCRICDPAIRWLTVDDAGSPLNLGRLRRLASAAQRHALAIRDGGCIFPGCNAPHRWVDIHHVKHWEDDGQTDINNLASLCRFHHGITHRTGWTMHATGTGSFGWTTPIGTVILSEPAHHRQRTRNLARAG